MYFQVCSNSAYPQHSSERYRTNGPLDYYSHDQNFKSGFEIKVCVNVYHFTYDIKNLEQLSFYVHYFQL